MAIRKPQIIILLTTILVIVFSGLAYLQHKRSDLCTQLTRDQLAERSPPLAELLTRQNAESNQLLARQRAEDFRMNIEMNSEQVSLEEALKASSRQIDEVAALRQQHKQAFDNMCRKLVDEQ